MSSMGVRRDFNRRVVTLRGNMDAAGLKKIFNFEGNDLTRAWRVVDGISTGAIDATATSKGFILHTDDEQKIITNMMSDNQVIGWIGSSPFVNQIDPNHIVVNNLFLSALAALNYLIILEEVKIDANQNIIYQIKERAQTNIKA